MTKAVKKLPVVKNGVVLGYALPYASKQALALLITRAAQEWREADGKVQLCWTDK